MLAARLECRPRRAHIIHQDDRQSPEPVRTRDDIEGSSDIGVTAGGRQVSLDGRGPVSAQYRLDPEVEVAGEVGRLVESPLETAEGVERDRNDEVGAGKQSVRPVAHQACQGARQRTASVVLQGLDGGPQRALVAPCSSRAVDESSATAAAWTELAR